MKIGLALGGGGVRGLAHISVLEMLDGIGLRPAVISGTSMGAVVGALYASGLSGKRIGQELRRHVILDADGWREIIAKRENLLRWVDWVALNFSRGGLLNVRGFVEDLLGEGGPETFEELEIPLLAVAADYWTAEEVVFETGGLLPAILASMAVPGVFSPVEFDGRILVDGGMVNLVPYDLLADRVDLTVAVDVSRARVPDALETPGTVESVLGSFNIMQAAALKEKMAHRPPDIYIRPEIRGVRMFEFGKVEEVFAQAAPAVSALKEELTARME